MEVFLMKKCLKIALCACMILLAAFAAVSCGKSVTGLTETYTEWKTDTTARNKESASAPLVSYADYDSALTADMKQSAYYLSLNGTWDFTYTGNVNSVPTDFMKTNFIYPDPNSTASVSSKTEILYWSTISVPGTFELQGYGTPIYKQSGYAWGTNLKPTNLPETDNSIGLYRRTVTVPKDWNGNEIYLNFEGVSSACYVYVNGEMVGYGSDTYTTKSFRITDFVKAGEDAVIAVKVFKYSYSSWIEAQDAIKFGGIYRDVYLTAAPKVSIRDISINSNLDSDYVNAAMLIDVDVASYIEPPKGYTLEISIVDQNGQTYITNRKLGGEVNFPVNKNTGSNYYLATAGGRLSAAEPVKWSAENPFLYTAVIALKDSDGNTVDIRSVRFGYCKAGYTVDDDGNQTFTMNGKAVKLYGVVYNEFSAETGSYVTYEQKVSDILALKAMNVNAIRSPGTPLSNDILKLCDEYGIYVVSDINLESEPYSNKGDTSIPGDQTIWQNVLVDRLYSVIERDKNNPCVIMWGLGNQSGEGTNFKSLRALLQQNDERLIVYDGDSSYSDLVVANDWSFTKINETLADTENKKPLLIESFKMGLLNGAGSITSYVALVDSNPKVQGGFFSYWIDKAIYWPKDSANAQSVLKNTPYSTNPSLYQLAYSGSWGDTVSDSYNGLTGLLTASRKWQSDAYEFKNAFSPIAVVAADVSVGKFTVTNKLNFTNFEDAYEICYDIYKEDSLVSSGKVSGLTLAPGESKDITVNYGNLDANTDYFVDITVKNLKATAWDSVSGGVVASWQFDVTDYAALPLTGGEETSYGDALSVQIVEKPEIVTTALDLVNGYFYITNKSSKNLSDIYECTYELYETNNFWSKPRPVLISSGSVALDVPAYTANKKLQMIYHNTQKAVEGGDYYIKIKLTMKKAIGDIPAGYVLVWNFNKDTMGVAIPFEVDTSRTPVQVLDEDGNPVVDENGNPVMEGGDPEPEDMTVIDLGDSELEEQEEYDPYTVFSNGKVTLMIDNASGTIIKFAIDGQDIFASSLTNSSPEFSVYRNPTGGDLNADDISDKSNDSIKTISKNSTSSHKLIDMIKLKKITNNHYQVALEYSLVDYDYSLFRNVNGDTTLSVTYDIYGNGELVISYAYDPTLMTGIPYEVSNILVLASGYDTFSWYGRGEGESYPDKLSNTRVSIYKNVGISDLLSDYLYNAGSGDRSDVRWLTVDGDDNIKILIASTSKNFAFNASYSNGMSAASYIRDVSSSNIFLRIIAEQRGSDVGTIAETGNYLGSSAVEPGKSVEFSYRIKPLSDSDDPMTAAKTYLSVDAPSVEETDIVSGATYSIMSTASSEEYLTLLDGAFSMTKGGGSDAQLWKKEDDTSIGMPGLFRMVSIKYDKILSPAYALKLDTVTSVEVGLGVYSKLRTWMNWQLTDTNQLYTVSIGWVLVPSSLDSGTHLTLQDAKKFEDGDLSITWEFEPIYEGSDIYRIVNKKTGTYLTVVDEISYRNIIVETEAERRLKYYGDVDWTSFKALSATPVKPADESGDSYWAKLEKTVTIWPLLADSTQSWVFTQTDEGEYRITNSKTGKAIAFDGNTLSEKSVSNDASQIWKISGDSGLYSIINKSNGYALSIGTERQMLSQQEIEESYITTEDQKYRDINVITCTPWTGAATQKWVLQSEADSEVIIEAGDAWFNTSASEDQ